MEAATSERPEADFVVMPKAAAKIFGISTRTLRRMQSRGEGPKRVRITDHRFGYRNSEIQKFLEARTEA